MRLFTGGFIGWGLLNIAISVAGCLLVGWSVWRMTSV